MQPQPAVRIHYLGHASFVLQFNNEVSVLTDYGQSKAYDLNSPVYEWVDAEPDVATFSHVHPDHKRPEMSFKQAYVLTGTDSLSLQGLEITPIQTSERSIETADNSSYLFSYKGWKILHLADAQAYIMAIEQEAVRQKVRELYRDEYDLLLMTIQGVNEFIPQAEQFIDLLHPVRVIPMHYWSPQYKAGFLTHVEKQSSKSYNIVEPGSAEYELYCNDKVSPMQVISLDPAPMPQAK